MSHSPVSKISYIYTHHRTVGTTGYFSCEPSPAPALEEALSLFESRPNDSFLKQYLLRLLSLLDNKAFGKLLADFLDNDSDCQDAPALASLFLEWIQISPSPPDRSRQEALEKIASRKGRILIAAPPPAAAKCAAIANVNIHGHKLLSPEDMRVFYDLYSQGRLQEEADCLTEQKGFLEGERQKLLSHGQPPREKIDPKITFARAMGALQSAGLLAGPEMRHEASLSPIALLRDWRIDMDIENGNVSHSLRGASTAFGRGLSLAGARAACAMEIVERASAYASIENGVALCKVAKRTGNAELLHATCNGLEEAGLLALDTELFCQTANSRDIYFHWLEGANRMGEPIFVPAQLVFLFCNLDEPDILASPGSSGLASGNDLTEAKLSALAEILERSAHASTPFILENCFELSAHDARIRSLLEDYRARNIRVRFQDISLESGFPAYRCFVTAMDGRVAQATGANLDGKRAIISALTETPWPYVWAKPAPWGTPSGPGPGKLPLRMLEDLPDYSLPSTETNLALLENMLGQQGREPVYVDITRSDLHIPVVRALVPGLGMEADFDQFNAPSPTFFARWLLAGNLP